MVEICLKILTASGEEIIKKCDKEQIHLFCQRTYEEGDRIVLEIAQKNQYVWVQFDDVLGKSLLYITGDMEFEIPFGEKRKNISPKAFCGKEHYLTVRIAKEYEVLAYRNLACNIYDQSTLINCYPHAMANVETRGESVFAARNAVDGITANESHGSWPYQSWGINMQDDAEIRVEFGRNIYTDRVVLYTRADFPHDNWWKQVSLTFSDGSKIVADLEKSRLPHEIVFEAKKIEWIQLSQLIKSEEPSPFPALTQIEVYGMDCR